MEGFQGTATGYPTSRDPLCHAGQPNVVPKFGIPLWGPLEMVQTAFINSVVVTDCTTERTTDVKLDGISLKWMEFLMSGLDHHHVGSTVGYHILETTLGGPA